MPHFETNGFNYTTYTIDPKGEVLQRPYALTAPFPEVIEETLTRFIAGEPWQGTSSGTAIVEVPIAQYGRLRLTASERQTFTDEEINTLNDFASAIALGYTRYLDFVNLETANTEIQIQTDRKSEFLASMSHELRTPWTAIRGYIDNMLDGITGELTERQTRNLTRVGQNSDHLLELINNLLDLTKIEAGRMDVEVAPFSIENLITTCCDTIEPLVKSGVELKKEVSEGADDASTDEAKLRHVIGNLLSNAVKFTDEGEIAVRARTVQDQLLISVSDTGIGMPPESLDTIFDEFQQVKGSNAGHKGTGLGLAIVRHYTELLSGTVSVESQIGQGTTFTIQIPKQLSVQ
jgi:signal transduction histidine kinase